MSVHPGRMFPDNSDQDVEFYKYGIGAMFWDTRGPLRSLVFLAPSNVPKGYELAAIFTKTDGKDWCVPGDVNGWDDNEERPTFTPSIWLRNKNGWHGFIRGGNLEDA